MVFFICSIICSSENRKFITFLRINNYISKLLISSTFFLKKYLKINKTPIQIINYVLKIVCRNEVTLLYFILLKYEIIYMIINR